MNADGKMDRHEFSIAMHLIKMKLKGVEVPDVLPVVLKNPPAPTMGTFGAAMGLGDVLKLFILISPTAWKVPLTS